ncbi:heme-dependent catalase [Polychaeton citri CBS 116435]|uniref:Heme-dependent catalase n=1 Tax=Polychaeton citri CBS 116435 TaxID=1314669 RepID=A0A9P4UP84_9PEZI|nr:heme-dependent catalase [Polychaeton citri CBS 116435]
MPSLIRWDDAQIDLEIEDENIKIEKLHDIINKVQERNFARHRHGFRGTHVKTQAIVKGSMKIASNLPEHLSQGLFSQEGRTFQIAMRYANEPSFLQDDRVPGPRGCGMKVFNVDGAGGFLDAVGERTHVQDFTFNNAPLLELTDLPTTLEIFTLRERYFDDPETLRQKLSERKDKDLQFAPTTLPNQHFMAYTMYSQSAYRYGDYIAKYALFPSSEFQNELTGTCSISQDSSPEQHSEWLREFFRSHEAKFDFRIQLCHDINSQSVEDCSKAWSESEYLFETVAEVTLPKGQDVTNAERRAFWDDHMSLNVWYGLNAHRPLGSVNRLRKTLYQASKKKREEINAIKIKEVSSIDEIP